MRVIFLSARSRACSDTNEVPEIATLFVDDGRQVSAVRTNLGGRLGDEHKQMPPDHPVLIAVTKFMTPLAQDVADGTMLRENLKTERDKRLGAAGRIGVSTNMRASMMKRPAQTRR